MYARPSQLRAANSRRVFRLLLSRGALSRAELARATGLSAMTAGNVVDDLMGQGLLEECGPSAEVGARSSMGRPPRNVRLSSSRELSIVELGVRQTAVIAQPLACDRTARRVEFRTPSTAAALLDEIGRARQALHLQRTTFVTISVPGVLEPETDTVLCSPNLRLIEEPRLLRRISELWSGRICAVQEIQALALGHQAAGNSPESFVLVDFGDGVGGAVVAGGQLFQSALPMSGELGHTGVSGNSRRCACGADGCLETLVSRRGLLKTFRLRTKRSRANWAALTGRVSEKGIEPWLAKAIDAAAVVIAGAINLVGTQDVVLMGDLPNLHPEVGPVFEQLIRKHSLIGRFARLTCVVAPRRRGLGLVAAAIDRVLLAEPDVASPLGSVHGALRA